MKRLSILFACALYLAGGCSDPQAADPTPDRKPTVAVDFSLRTIDTQTSIEPMTRATTYKQWFSNRYRMLLLKKWDSRWIVDDALTLTLDPTKSASTELKLAGESLAASFSVELRPGDYRAVVVLNPRAATWNSELVPGKVVADEADPSLRTPPLISYTIITEPWSMNRGYRMLNREVFVAVADFTVPKSDELHAQGMPPVTLRAERRVGKIRFLLKDKRTPVNDFSFERTAHTFRMKLRSAGFPEGIDALGDTYYGDPLLAELPWCMSTVGDFHASGAERYQMCQTNSTVFSPFLFADPDRELPFEAHEMVIYGASGGFTYATDEVFSFTLAASRIEGLVFEATDNYELSSSQPVIEVVRAVGADGNLEDAVALFDPFYEWNATSY